MRVIDVAAPELASLGRRARRAELRASPLATVVGCVALGTGLQGLAYALGYFGDNGPVLWLFFAGLALTYFPCGVALLSKSTLASDRRGIVVTLGLALLAASLIESPLRPVEFDELLHEATLWQLPYARELFTANSVLPISTYYPGLELTTLGVKLLTGLSSVAAGDLTLALTRFVLIGAIYLVVARLVRSERAGGIAVLVYVASPQFYGFNAAYSYQTLALTFAAAAIYFAIVAVDRDEPRFGTHAWLAVASLAALIVTHHLVSWLTIALFAVWTLFAAVRRNQQQFRLLVKITFVGFAMCLVWTIVAWGELRPYLSPILVAAWDGLIGLLHGGTHRQLFHTKTGGTTPWPQELLVLASVVVFLVLVVVSLCSVLFRRSLRGGASRFIPLVVAAGYPFVLVSALSATSAEVGQRASTFVFFGVALIVAAWLSTTRMRIPPRVGAGVLTVCFLGSVVLGSGPIWTAVPGPYAPAADARSVDAPSIAVADWAAQHLPVNATIAADTENGALIAAIGHLQPVQAMAGSVNTAPLFMSHTFNDEDRAIIRAGAIRYLLVDERLTSGPPSISTDYEPDAELTYRHPTQADLAKFASVPGAALIYNAGPIKVYDISALDGRAPPAPSPPLAGLAMSSGNPAVFAGACLILLIVLLLRRRRGPLNLEGGLVAATVALTTLLVIGLVAIYAGFASSPAALLWLALGGLLLVFSTPKRQKKEEDVMIPVTGSTARAGIFAMLAVTVAAFAVVLDLHAASEAWHDTHAPAGVHLVADAPPRTTAAPTLHSPSSASSPSSSAAAEVQR